MEKTYNRSQSESDDEDSNSNIMDSKKSLMNANDSIVRNEDITIPKEETKISKSKRSKGKKTNQKTKQSRDSFNAIYSFVMDVWDIFGQTKKVTPLSLYHRIIESTKLSDLDTIEKIIGGFQTFLTLYNEPILAGELSKIPKGTKISYGTNEKIYLDIQRFIYKSRDDEDTLKAIRDHLVNISCILEPNSIKLAELEKMAELAKKGFNIDTNTKEGQFINNLMQKAKTSMSNVKSGNSMEAVVALAQSGIMQDMVSGLQNGVQSGEMKFDALLKTMHGAMGALIPQDEEPNSNHSDTEDKFDDVD